MPWLIIISAAFILLSFTQILQVIAIVSAGAIYQYYSAG